MASGPPVSPADHSSHTKGPGHFQAQECASSPTQHLHSHNFTICRGKRAISSSHARTTACHQVTNRSSPLQNCLCLAEAALTLKGLLRAEPRQHELHRETWLTLLWDHADASFQSLKTQCLIFHRAAGQHHLPPLASLSSQGTQLQKTLPWTDSVVDRLSRRPR